MIFHKYLKIRTFGHFENKGIFDNPEDEIIVEEKIDGGNFRFYIHKDGYLIFGSRSQELTEDKDHKYQKNFNRCIKYIKDTLKDKLLTHMTGLIFYGECITKHTMEYDWDNIPPFLGFDIYYNTDEGDEGFLYYDTKKILFDALGLKVVPLIRIYKASEIGKIDDSIVPISKYAPKAKPTQKAEGIVFKNYSKQLFAKYVRDEFKEENATAFGGNPKYNQTNNNNADFLFKYCTNARIDKVIFKLLDDDFKLHLELMAVLPKAVMLDIWEEHWQDIRDSNWILDIKQLRRLIPKRCLAVLQQVIANNALGGV